MIIHILLFAGKYNISNEINQLYLMYANEPAIELICRQKSSVDNNYKKRKSCTKMQIFSGACAAEFSENSYIFLKQKHRDENVKHSGIPKLNGYAMYMEISLRTSEWNGLFTKTYRDNEKHIIYDYFKRLEMSCEENAAWIARIETLSKLEKNQFKPCMVTKGMEIINVCKRLMKVKPMQMMRKFCINRARDGILVGNGYSYKNYCKKRENYVLINGKSDFKIKFLNMSVNNVILKYGFYKYSISHSRFSNDAQVSACCLGMYERLFRKPTYYSGGYIFTLRCKFDLIGHTRNKMIKDKEKIIPMHPFYDCCT